MSGWAIRLRSDLGICRGRETRRRFHGAPHRRPTVRSAFGDGCQAVPTVHDVVRLTNRRRHRINIWGHRYLGSSVPSGTSPAVTVASLLVVLLHEPGGLPTGFPDGGLYTCGSAPGTTVTVLLVLVLYLHAPSVYHRNVTLIWNVYSVPSTRGGDLQVLSPPVGPEYCIITHSPQAPRAVLIRRS